MSAMHLPALKGRRELTPGNSVFCLYYISYSFCGKCKPPYIYVFPDCLLLYPKIAWKFPAVTFLTWCDRVMGPWTAFYKASGPSSYVVDLDVILFLVLKMNELIISHDACVVVEFHVTKFKREGCIGRSAGWEKGTQWFGSVPPFLCLSESWASSQITWGL